MSPEEKARLVIDQKLIQSGWVIQDTKQLNISASLGVAVREYPTSTVSETTAAEMRTTYKVGFKDGATMMQEIQN